MTTHRSYVKDFTLRLGAASTTGRLYGITKPAEDEVKLVLCTPTGDTVKQMYVDASDKLWEYSQLHRGQMIEPGVLAYVGPSETIRDVKKSDFPNNVLNLSVHKLEDVERSILPAKTQGYVFKPEEKDPANVQWHDFLYTMIAESGAAFIGMCCLKGHEGLFRVTIHEGMLFIQKQLYPHELHHFDARTVDIPPAVKTKGFGIVASLIEEFDPEAYKSTANEKLLALAETGVVPEPAVDTAPAGEIDLMAALENF